MIFYSYCIQIHVLGFDELLESIFCRLLAVEVFPLRNRVKMREEVVAGWHAPAVAVAGGQSPTARPLQL